MNLALILGAIGITYLAVSLLGLYVAYIRWEAKARRAALASANRGGAA